MRVISGTARGTVLKTPEGLSTRPTSDRVKEALFSILQFDLPGMRVLDLFGGTGQLGIEAISRGAKSCVFVDAGEKACSLIRENVKRCKMEQQCRIVRGDYLQFLQNCRETFDIVFLDPPYAEVFLENALKKISEIDILSDRGIIICERPTEKVMPLEIPGLQLKKDYRYGKTIISVYRRMNAEEV